MTLIAAFRCTAATDSGVVICADSQESYGAYKVTVDKIKPREAGNYDLVIGGSGNTAALIDGQADFIERLISKWPCGITEEQGRESLEEIVIAYHERHVKFYPANFEDKLLTFLVCARSKTAGDVYLWKTDGTTAATVTNYDLIGWDEPLYRNEVQRLYQSGISASQATLIGLHLLSVGDATNRYISDPFQVIALSKHRVLTEHPDNIKALEKKVKSFNQMLSKLIISTPDLSVSDDKFNAALQKFREEILGLREAVSGYSGYSSVGGRFILAEPPFVPESEKHQREEALAKAVKVVEESLKEKDHESD